MVLVFSAHANTSQHVLNEVNLAVESRLVIIPFKIEDALVSDELRYYTGAKHWLDAMTPPLAAHLDKLTGSVKHFIAHSPFDPQHAPQEAIKGIRSTRKPVPVLVALGGLALVSVGAMVWLAVNRTAGNGVAQSTASSPTSQSQPAGGGRGGNGATAQPELLSPLVPASPAVQAKLGRALQEDDGAALAPLLSAVDLDSMSIEGHPPLYWAAFHGSAGVTEGLLKAGARVNARSGKENQTALHVAVFRGKHAVVKQLLEAQADPSLKTSDNSTALHLAAASGHGAASIPLLLGHGADVEAVNQKGWTPLHTAAFYHASAEARALLHGNPPASVDPRTPQGATPLFLALENAVRSQDPELDATVDILLDAGADAGIRNRDGQTPMDLARAKGLQRVVERLTQTATRSSP